MGWSDMEMKKHPTDGYVCQQSKANSTLTDT